MILERHPDGSKMVTSLAFPRRMIRPSLLSVLAQMGRAFMVNLRRTV